MPNPPEKGRRSFDLTPEAAERHREANRRYFEAREKGEARQNAWDYNRILIRQLAYLYKIKPGLRPAIEDAVRKKRQAANLEYHAVTPMIKGPGIHDTYVTTVEHTIPFELTSHNNIAVKALLNQRDQVVLMFHTAVDSVSMTRAAARRARSVKFDEAASITSWGGQSAPSRYSTENTLQIRGLTWRNVGITEGELSGHFTDGKFGPSQFGNNPLEIDFDNRRLRVHTTLPDTKSYSRFSIERRDGSMFLKGAIQVGDTEIENSFMVHSGFGGAVLFDDKFAAEKKLTDKLRITGSRELRDSMGNVLKTSKVVVPTLRFGRYSLANVPAEVFSGAIGRQKISLIGGDVLRRFNIIIDAAKGHIYLRPGHAFDAAFD